MLLELSEYSKKKITDIYNRSFNYKCKFEKINSNEMCSFIYTNCLFGLRLDYCTLSFFSNYKFPSMNLLREEKYNGENIHCWENFSLKNFRYSKYYKDKSDFPDKHKRKIKPKYSTVYATSDNEFSTEFDLIESIPFEAMLLIKIASECNFVNFNSSNIKSITFTHNKRKHFNMCKSDGDIFITKYISHGSLPGNLHILNKNWINSDIGINRFSPNKSSSKYTSDVLNNINKKFEKYKIYDHSGKVSQFDIIKQEAVYQGGINLESINWFYNSFYEIYYRTLIRINSKEDKTWRDYSTNEAPILSILLFNDLLMSENVNTEIEIEQDDITFTSKYETNENKFSDLYESIKLLFYDT